MFFSLRFLKAENVGPMLLQEGEKHAFFMYGANAIHIPRNDFHTAIVYLNCSISHSLQVVALVYTLCILGVWQQRQR
jgi:hypothetical protein